jgi:hypothetical protein
MIRPTVCPADWQALEPHPLANLFPMLEGESLQALVDDIRTNTFDPDRPIVLFEGKILDGRNRHGACVVLDGEGALSSGPHFAQYDALDCDPSPLDWVISVNLHRRHLTESQRAMVAAEIANMKQGDNRFTVDMQICMSTPVTVAEAATMLNVSPRSVSTARAVRDAAPELAEEVKAGRITLNAAHREMKGTSDRPKAFDATKIVSDLAKKLSAEQLEAVHDALGDFLIGRTI